MHLLTTAAGAERTRLMPFEADGGQFNQFCDDHGLEGLKRGFSPDDIEAVRGPDGQPLQDIVRAAAMRRWRMPSCGAFGHMRLILTARCTPPSPEGARSWAWPWR